MTVEEVSQRAIGARTFDLVDLVATWIGVGLAVAAARWWLRRRAAAPDSAREAFG